MGKIHHVLAVLPTIRKACVSAMEAAYGKRMKTKEVFEGFERTFSPLMETLNDRPLPVIPPESKKVTLTVPQVIEDMRAACVEAINTTFNLDQANAAAKADLVVDGVTLAKDVPATTFLYLEKLVENWIAVAKEIPVLSADQDWKYSDDDLFVSEQKTSFRTAKVPRVLVKYQATEQHPAQTELLQEDVTTYQITTRNFSGARRSDEKSVLLERLKKLQAAIRFARETANETEVPNHKIGENLFDYAFGNDLFRKQSA